MRKSRLNSKFIAMSAIIAAIYVLLCGVLQPISFGPLQFRVAEALTVLPYFTPTGIYGLTVGCLISNILFSGNILDMIFGTLATLIAAIMSYKIKNKWLVPLPPILVNAVIVGLVISYTGNITNIVGILTICGEILISQVGSCYIIGMILILTLEKHKNLFKI